MKRKIYLLLLVVVVMLTSCSKKNSVETQSEEKKVIKVADNYTGIGGYIMEDAVFDYSDRFETVYEWCDGIKLPIEKMNVGNIQHVVGSSDYYGAYSLIEVSNLSETDFLDYIDMLENAGYSKKIEKGISVDSYHMYKDNLMVSFMYNNENNIATVYFVAGNVVRNEMLNIQDARKIIDESEVLKSNEYFSEYVLLEIAHETVMKAGYSEYWVVSPGNYAAIEDEKLPYYVIIEGEKIVLFEQGATTIKHPSNANIIEENDGEIKLIVSTVEYNISSSAIPYKGCIKTYVMKDGKFQYDDTTKEITADNRFLLGIYENNKMAYYLLKENENFDGKKGYRDKYIIDKEYVVE